MQYKVNYYPVWSPEGATYRQTIKAHLTKEELKKLNIYILACRGKYPELAIYLRPLVFGTNYSKLSQRKVFTEFFRLEKDKRIKTDRNTRIIIY